LESIETEILIELILSLESSIDVQFQAWMAISFAVIVACYSAKGELSTGIRSIVALIYTLIAYALFARWATEMARLDVMQEILATRGLMFDTIMYAPAARMLAYFLGSLTTVGAAFYFGNRKGNNVPIDT